MNFKKLGKLLPTGVEMRPFNEIRLVSAEDWDFSVLLKCPHLDSYKKADSLRWSSFLSRVDKKFTVEAVDQAIRAMNATTFKNPLDIITDKQVRLMANSARDHAKTNIREVLSPFAASLLVSNDQPGSVLNHCHDVINGRFDAEKNIAKEVRELCHERADSLKRGKPGLSVNLEDHHVAGLDNEDLIALGYIERPIDMVGKIVKDFRNCMGGLHPRQQNEANLIDRVGKICTRLGRVCNDKTTALLLHKFAKEGESSKVMGILSNLAKSVDAGQMSPNIKLGDGILRSGTAHGSNISSSGGNTHRPKSSRRNDYLP